MRRTLAVVAIGATALLAWASPAYAADPIQVQSECISGWYVNADEEKLLPKQTPDGLLFDGPSLVHHATDLDLADLKPGTFTSKVELGVAPLFKVETTAPYSTLNLAGGKWWSSKIDAAAKGGQSQPVDATDLVGLWQYTADTRVFSFGVGYANDQGNKAVVTAVTFGGKTYDLTCQPPASPSPSASATSAGPSPAPSGGGAGAQPGATATPAAGAGGLPVTGSPVGLIAGGAVGLVVVGAVAWLIARRRRVRFTA